MFFATFKYQMDLFIDYCPFNQFFILPCFILQVCYFKILIALFCFIEFFKMGKVDEKKKTYGHYKMTIYFVQ